MACYTPFLFLGVSFFAAYTTTFGGEAGVPVSIESCLHNTTISFMKEVAYKQQQLKKNINFRHLLVIGLGLPCMTGNEDVSPRGVPKDD